MKRWFAAISVMTIAATLLVLYAIKRWNPLNLAPKL